MKSPFFRFPSSILSAVSWATLCACALSGCRHLPKSFFHRDTNEVVASESVEEPEEFLSEVTTDPAAVFDPRCRERPLVAIPNESDVTLPERPTKAEPSVTPATEVPQVPTTAAAPLAKVVPYESDADDEVLPNQSALPVIEPAKPLESPAKPAPTKSPRVDQVDEDDVFSELRSGPSAPVPAPVAALEVPPEPMPVSEARSNSNSDNTSLLDDDELFPQDSAKKAVASPVEPTTSSQKTESTQEVPVRESNEEALIRPLFAPKPSASERSIARASTREVEAGQATDTLADSEPRLENEILALESHCDGLVFDVQGFGYVSHKNHIVRFSPAGQSEIWATLSSPKGHRIEPEGTHLVCDLQRREVLRLSFAGKVVGVAAKECDGQPLRAPFDIAVDPQGGFYFTDPGFAPTTNSIGKLHYVDRVGRVSVVAAKMGFPTSVVYDSERQRVLVLESLFNRVVEFRLSEPGKIESHQILVELPKSSNTEHHLASLCLDRDGLLYVTQQQDRSVSLFDPMGRPAGRFSTGNVLPSSVALRFPEANDLFLTGDLASPHRGSRVLRLNLGQ